MNNGYADLWRIGDTQKEERPFYGIDLYDVSYGVVIYEKAIHTTTPRQVAQADAGTTPWGNLCWVVSTMVATTSRPLRSHSSRFFSA